MEQKDILSVIDGVDGYTTQISLSKEDLKTLQQMIHAQWLYRLQTLSAKNVKIFYELGVLQYHQGSHLIEHATAWPKVARILPPQAVNIVRNMQFMKDIKEQIGEFYVSDEEHLGWENMYWRLVRPGESDVGSIHADKWFWDIGSYGKVAEFPHRRLKIWIAIHTVVNQSGLLVLPSSHLKSDWKWHAEEKYGLQKPVIDEAAENLDMRLLPLAPGETVMFHDSLLHGGAPNKSSETRVSLEFTLLSPI